MKKIIYSLILVIGVFNAKAQELKKVYSIVREMQSEDWYKTQQSLWGKEVEKDTLNAVAWENYYNAARALKNISWQDKELNKKRREVTGKIADEAILAIPNTYQGNLIAWRESGNNPVVIHFLEKAYELNPNNEEVLVNMLTQAKLMGKDKEYSKYCKQYYKTNDVPVGLLNWGLNLLSGLDQKAIVFTSGDNDTYPLWLMQEAKNIRKDIQVLNVYLLMENDYRNKLFLELGLPILDVDMLSYKTQKEYETNKTKIIDHVFSNYKHSVYVVSTSVESFKPEYGSQLHLTGLAYKYSKENFDNISLIIRNFEKRYLLDYLTITLSFNIGNKVAENAQVMYLPALTKLYKHYKNTEQAEKLKGVKELLLLIGERTGSLEEVNEILEK